MCPNMYFGIAAIVNAEYDKEKIKDVVGKTSRAHPFLKATLGFEETANRYFYDVQDSSKVSLAVCEGDILDVNSPVVMKEYERLISRDWNLFEEGMLKIVTWKGGSPDKTCFLFVFHHLLADGRGALALVREIADCYAKDAAPKFAEEKLISSKADFPEGSELSFVSRYFVNKANRLWTRENHKALSYNEYNKFADEFTNLHPVTHSFEIIEGEQLSALVAECKNKELTVNDFLLAKMFVEEKTDKIIIARDLREDLSFYSPASLGNYSTAFSINLKKKSADKIAVAKEVHKSVQKSLKKIKSQYLVLQCYAELNPALLDASFMAAQERFNSKAAAFVGKLFFGYDNPKGFSITNLGKISSDVIDSACFIPPASPAIRKTWGALTVNGRLVICSSER